MNQICLYEKKDFFCFQHTILQAYSLQKKAAYVPT